METQELGAYLQHIFNKYVKSEDDKRRTFQVGWRLVKLDGKHCDEAGYQPSRLTIMKVTKLLYVWWLVATIFVKRTKLDKRRLNLT